MKGVYIVNLVDEVTQYEYVGVVRGISERFLVPALQACGGVLLGRSVARNWSAFRQVFRDLVQPCRRLDL